jgi:hypothetical protein
MIKVTCEVKVYELNGIPCGTEEQNILIYSHPIKDDRVEITLAGTNIVVVADDLIADIENATNTKRF